MGDKSTMLNMKEDKEEDLEALPEPLDWLPDGWEIEVYREEDGTINWYYISPVSGYTFTTESEVLDYLFFSGEDERILESKEECAEKTESTIQKLHRWLPKGWVIEIRAGGEKMFKFYVHSQTGVRQLSKDVLRYASYKKISECDTEGQCDTCSEDNILANGFEPASLRNFKRILQGDPTSGYTSRSMKSALNYLQTGKIPNHAIIQETSVHDLYSFDKSADLHLRKRLTTNEKHGQKLKRSSQPRETSKIEHRSKKTTGEQATSSETMKHPRGRPPKFGSNRDASLKEK